MGGVYSAPFAALTPPNKRPPFQKPDSTLNNPIQRLDNPGHVNPVGNKRILPGQNLEFTVFGTDPEGAEVSYYADNLPDGASFDTETGEFSWTPNQDQSGAYVDLVFAVTDGPRYDYEFVAITVDGDNGTISSFDLSQQFDTLEVTAQLTNSGPVQEGDPENPTPEATVTVTFSVQTPPPEGTDFIFWFDWDSSDGVSFALNSGQLAATYDAAQVETFASVGGHRTDLSQILQGQADYDFLLNFTDINDAGQVVYTLTNEDYYEHYVGAYDSGSPQSNSVAIVPWGTFSRPLITDDGAALYQHGSSPTSPIVLKKVDHEGVAIAKSSSQFYSPDYANNEITYGFSRIGRNPGVGSDGQAVAFMAREKNPQGEFDGIYLSVPYGPLSRRIYRIVAPADGPNDTPFTHINYKDRVAVTEVDSVGGVTVTFVATDSMGKRGLYTVRVVGIDDGLIQVSQVIPVLRTGDPIEIDGVKRVVTNLAVNDPLNDRNELAFWIAWKTANSNGQPVEPSGEAILRATPPNIKASVSQLSGSNEIRLNYEVEDLDVTHPFRVDIYASEDHELSKTEDTHMGYVEIYSDVVVSYDADGNLVEPQSPDVPSVWTNANPFSSFGGAPSESFWKIGTHDASLMLSSDYAVAVSAPTVSYMLTLVNDNSEMSIAEGRHDDNKADTNVVKINEYLGERNDKKLTLNFDRLLSGRSASTDVTIANYTEEDVEITHVRLIDWAPAFELPLMTSQEAATFSSDHSIPFAGFINKDTLLGGTAGGQLTAPLLLELSTPPSDPFAVDPDAKFATILLRFAPPRSDNDTPYSGALVITYREKATGVSHTSKYRLTGTGIANPEVAASTPPPLYVLTPGRQADSTDWIAAMKRAIIAADPWFADSGVDPANAFITAPYPNQSPNDWTVDVWRESPGFAQAAGEALAAQIMSQVTVSAASIDQPRIHMTGHDIGAVVSNEAARRLDYYDDRITIDQMTLLDPVGYDKAGPFYYQDKLDLPRIIIPDNVDWSDVYYQHNAIPGSSWPTMVGTAIGKYASEPVDSPIQDHGAHINVNLSRVASVNGNDEEFTVDHTDIRRWYLGTIVADDTAWRTAGNTSALTPDEKAVH